MKNTLLSVYEAACLLILGAGSVDRLHSEGTAPVVPWPHEGSDLQPNEAIKFGRLDNGFRYVILPNKEPKDRISLRLCVDAGSMMESESERGIAHFLEHMAFNGSEHFPAGTVMEFFARLKMGFVADTNAMTTCSATKYMLELPDGADATLNESLNFFRDVAGGLTLSDKEIEEERGVILSEKRDGDNSTSRMFDQLREFMMPEMILSKRDPIGLDIVIKTAPRDRFMQFYRKWYTPDRITLIAVGAVDAAEMEKRIQQKFGDLKAAPQRRPNPDLGNVTAGRGLEAKLVTGKDLGTCKIFLMAVRSNEQSVDNLESRRQSLVRNAAYEMLNRRLQIIRNKENAPFLSGSAGHSENDPMPTIDELDLTCEPQYWEKALAAGEQELRRAVEFGFSEDEITQMKANLLAIAESSFAQAATARSADLAAGMANAIEKGRVPTSLADDAQFLKVEVAKVTAEQCHEALRRAWDTTDLKIFVAGDVELKDAEAAIKTAYLKSREVPVQAGEARKQGTFAYTQFGTPGKVALREEVNDLGLTLVTFENNVRLNIRPTTFDKDAVIVRAAFGGGRLSLPEGKPALASIAPAVFVPGGLEKHTLDELNALLAGKLAGVRFEVESDSFALSGGTNQQNLLFECQLLAAYLTAPAYREQALIRVRPIMEATFAQIPADPVALFAQEEGPLLRNGNWRFAEGSKDEFLGTSIGEIKAWLEQPLREGFLEVAIVGDVDVDAAISAVASTLGALPKRAAAPLPYLQERKVEMAAFKEKTLAAVTKDPMALSVVIWPTTDARTGLKPVLEMEVLAAVLTDLLREELREKLGATYTPTAYSSMSSVFDGDGKVQTVLKCDQSRVDEVGRIAIKLAADLAANGATQDQFDRAKRPIVKHYEDFFRSNNWWLACAADAQSDPQSLVRSRTLARDLEAVSLDSINARAKQYFGADRAVVVKVVPADKEVPEPVKLVP